ncbi:hypothetical protein GLOIN_2v1766467 [Rhizophagus irregularis DAOM 181602=DAOM 197198]|nr:hypothetical protein GLOIN_2v1766467 [Rhizophagus irregularis DAOM 181602=DAOM 197198]
MRINQSQSSSSQNPRSAQTNQVLQRPIEEIIVTDFTLPPNAAAQKKAVETINTINTKLAKLQQVYNSTNDLEIQNNLLEHMTTFKQFGAADKKRRKEIIKVQTIRHLRENLNSKYNEYLSRTTFNNYLLPSRSNTKAAKTYHHLAIIANASVSRNKKNKHIDEHYCFTFMKGANQFAALFSTNSIIISQDDKAKVSLVDGSLDKNPRHMKNIYQYCRIFYTFDLDYLSIQTYAPSQSAYNPVERSMAMLSQKLASITLPINKYGSHLNSQGQVDDLKLAMINSCSGCFYNIPAFSKKSAIKQCCNNEKCFFQVAAYLRTPNNIYKSKSSEVPDKFSAAYKKLWFQLSCDILVQF